MAVKLVLSLLTLLALQAAAQEPDYFEIGKNKRFDPKFSGTISSITWKHKGNIIAEYIQDAVDLEYLGDLKGRADVNLTTGVLTVRNMRKSDDGQFTVEINNRVHPVLFTAVGIRNLENYHVEVIVRPLTCNSNDDKCSLECGEKFTEAEPVRYFWRKGEAGQWEEGDKKMNISTETQPFETFTCRAENRFSTKTSDPYKNPFNEPPGSSVLILVIVCLVILAAGGGIVAWLIIKKPLCVQNLLSRDSGQPTENPKELEGLSPNSNPEPGVNSSD